MNAPSTEGKGLDATYQHSLARRLWEAQLSEASDEHKRLMAEAAQELEVRMPAATSIEALQRRCYELEKALQAYIVACAYADEASIAAAIRSAYREAVRLVPAPVTTTGAKQ